MTHSAARLKKEKQTAYDIDWGNWFHSVHNHLWEHFHGHHHNADS